MSVPYFKEQDSVKRIFCCGVPVTIDVSPYNSSNIIVKYDGGEFEAPKNCTIYGGYDSINNEVGEVPFTSIIMNGGEVYSLNGSNWGPSEIGTARIIVNGGEVAYVSAGVGEGGSDVVSYWDEYKSIGKCHIETSNIIVNGGSVLSSLFGGLGAGWGTVDNVYLEINGGEVRYATGTNGLFFGDHPTAGAKNVKTTVKGGEIEYLYGCSDSTIGNVEMNVSGGNIGLCSMYGLNIFGPEPKTTIEANLFGGTIDKLCVNANNTISASDAKLLENIEISYAPGVINEADIANSPKEIKEDPQKGQGAEMKTVRVYPFPHKCDRIFGILTDGMPIDKPCELPMTEQEIRMCLGMGHIFEVVNGRLILLDEENYNKDNRSAKEYAGALPCEDCELEYPRAVEEDAEKPATKKKSTRKSSKVEEFTPIPVVVSASTLTETPIQEVKVEEPKQEEPKAE